MNPKLSIIITVYNKEKYLHKCINSILNQNEKDFEIILINDGSTDISGQICNEYSSKDDRVITIHQQNKGHSAARNAGINASKGKFIMFVDADDYLFNDQVLKLMDASIKINESDLVIGEILSIDLNGAQSITYPNMTINFMEFNGIEILGLLMKHNMYFAVMCTKLYKRDLIIKNNLFFQEGLIHDDEEWTPKIFYFANKVSFVSEPCYVRQILSDSVTRVSTENNVYKKAFDRVVVSSSLLNFFSHKNIQDWIREKIITYCIGFYNSAIHTAAFDLSDSIYIDGLIRHLEENKEILRYSRYSAEFRYKILYGLSLCMNIENVIKLYKKYYLLKLKR